MGAFSGWHMLLLAMVAVLVFGGSGKISSIMGDVAKGIKSFKKGMADEDDVAKKAETAKTIEAQAHKTVDSVTPSKVG